jgi:hypothetical protein
LKTTYKNYVSLALFILFLAITIALYILSTQNYESKQNLLSLAIFASVFTAMFCDSVTDITIANLYNKARLKHPKQMINFMRVIKYSGHAAGYLQASILSFGSMFFYSSLMGSSVLITMSILLGCIMLLLLASKILRIKLYLIDDQLPK